VASKLLEIFSLMPIVISDSQHISNAVERLIESEVELIITPPLKDTILGLGTLTISEQALYWNNQTKFISIDYPTIIIHAIQQQPPAIYCQLASNVFVDKMGIQLQQNEINEDSEQICIEISIVPRDTGKLDQIFQIISECSRLHPDEQMDDERGWITADNVDGFFPDEAGVAALDKLDALLVDKVNENGKRDGQFDDANEDLLR
jgi:hypothetical protein